MNMRMLLLIVFASAFFVSACARHEKKKLAENSSLTSSAAPSEIEGTHYTALEFDAGSHSLTEQGRQKLSSFARKMNIKERGIEEIKILAWADSEYPLPGERVPSAEVKLAKNRASAIRKFLRDDMATNGRIVSFNMAKKTGPISQFFQNSDYQVKQAVAESTPTATRNDEGKISYTKSSKALVIVEYQN